MARVKDYNTMTQKVSAIQFVRNAMLEIIDFVDGRDCQFYFKEGKFSGVVTNKDNLEKLNVIGKDYLVKDKFGYLTVWKPDDFSKNFVLIENEGE